MTASIPPNVHEEIHFLDEIERELVALTTAQLEGIVAVEAMVELPVSTTRKTVIPAQAGTHAESDVPTEGQGVVTRPGYGSRRAPG
jgi:hypothetical protein